MTTLTITLTRETAGAVLQAMSERATRLEAARNPRLLSQRESAAQLADEARTAYHEVLDALGEATR